MGAEGMVHALEKIHGWLRENGRLIDIHPHPDEPEIVVRLGATEHPAGWLHESDDRVEYGQADEALNGVIRRGLFRRLRQETFLFHTYAPNMAALRAFLAENWQDAVVDDLVAMRAEDLLKAPQPGEIVLKEKVKISVLARAKG